MWCGVRCGVVQLVPSIVHPFRPMQRFRQYNTSMINDVDLVTAMDQQLSWVYRALALHLGRHNPLETAF